MRHFINIQLLTTALISFQIGINKVYFPCKHTKLDQPHQAVVYSYDTINTISAIATIDSLKIGQSYFINVESNGCFHHSNLNLKILKETDGYFASFRMAGKIEGQKVNTKFKKTKLSEFQIDSIRNFERELILISASKYDCTTVDQYTLAVGTLKNIYIVDKCDWQGIGKLINGIFKNTE